MSKTIRLILADDHAVLREGTAALLQREGDLEVVGQAPDGMAAVELTQQFKPDVVVMDVRMPLMSGIEATREIRSALPETKVLVLTAHDNDQYVFSLLQEGASGYLLKTSPVSDLVKAIRQVCEGQTPLDPSIARKIVARVGSRPGTADASSMETPAAEVLTPREIEVLELVAKGLINRAVAETLDISDRTVQAHLTNIFAKMGVGSRVEAVLSGIRRGWLTLES